MLNLGVKKWVRRDTDVEKSMLHFQPTMLLPRFFMALFLYTRMLPSMDDASAKMRLDLNLSELEDLFSYYNSHEHRATKTKASDLLHFRREHDSERMSSQSS